MPIHFDGRVLLLGFGAVGRCFLPLLLGHVRVPPGRILVIDMHDRRRDLAPWLRRGVRFRRERITPGRLAATLARHVSARDLIVDLAWNIECADIIEWARRHQVHYVNASIEKWDTAAGAPHAAPALEHSLYRAYTALLERQSAWAGAATAVLDHGANPGLISHFVKRGLMDLAAAVLRDGRARGARARRIERLAGAGAFARLAESLGVKTIHCSERDLQRAARPKGRDEFVGTWSVVGLIEEAVAPVEIGWGTHERRLPAHAVVPAEGPGNQIILPHMGLNTWVRSWVPRQEFVGMAVTHGESFTLSHWLTVRDRAGALRYRPTVHYAYLPSNETLISLHELRSRGYEPPARQRILRDRDIRDGQDIMGALIMGHAYGAWWTGSLLDIREARRLVPHQNATTVQVAIGVVAAVRWLLRHPCQGLCFPEDLPHEDILAVARPYLGRVLSEPAPWTPLKHHRVFFSDQPLAQPDRTDPWQFGNFLAPP